MGTADITKIKTRLRNWARWSTQPVVDLDIPPPPWAANWIPSNSWDSGWGDTGAPDDGKDPVFEKDAYRVEKAIIRLSIAHRTTIKRHYIIRRRQPPEMLDYACRALGDILYDNVIS